MSESDRDLFPQQPEAGGPVRRRRSARYHSVTDAVDAQPSDTLPQEPLPHAAQGVPAPLQEPPVPAPLPMQHHEQTAPDRQSAPLPPAQPQRSRMRTTYGSPQGNEPPAVPFASYTPPAQPGSYASQGGYGYYPPQQTQYQQPGPYSQPGAYPPSPQGAHTAREQLPVYTQPQMPLRNDAAAYPSDYWQGYPGQHQQMNTGAYATGEQGYPPHSVPVNGVPMNSVPMNGAQMPGAQIPGAQMGYPPRQMPGAPYPASGRQVPTPQSGWSQPQQRVNAPNYLMGSGSHPAWSEQKQKPAAFLRLKEIKLPRVSLDAIPKTVRKWLAFALAICVIVATLYVVISSSIERQRYEALVAEVSAYDGRFCQGVYVDGIHLGGMTQQEAVNEVMSQAYRRNDAWCVQLVHEGTVCSEIRAAQLGMQVDVSEAMNAAWQQGHQGDYEARKQAMDELLAAPFHAASVKPTGDTSVVDSILNDLANRFFEPAQDAYMVAFNPQLTEPFEFSPERSGRCLNTDELKERLYQMVSDMESGTVELELTELPPRTTVEQLRATQYAVRAVATTDISTSSDDNRNNNIRRAFALVSGTAIQSGGSFSFNNVVGERTERNGFYPAQEYVYGQIDTGIGGGVCQASTTIYQAAIYAGMNILTRYPHGLTVNYAELGKDATVYWYSNHRRDLVFQNTTAYPIYIKAAVESKPGNRNRLITKVTIYGQPLEEGVKYDFATEEEILPAPVEPEIRPDNKGEYVVYVDEPPYEFQTAKDGVKVSSYRVKYVNGQEVERVFLATDTYPARQQILYTGVTIRPLETEVPEQ